MSGWCGGTLASGVPTAFAGWNLIPGILIGVAALAGLYALIGPFAGWWLPGRKSTLAAVIDEAKALSAQIASWLNSWEFSEPSVFRRPDVRDEAVRHEMWVAENENRAHHTRKMHASWNQLFAVRALTSYDSLVAHGAKPIKGGDRFSIEHPTNPLGMRRVSAVLGVMAAHLESRTSS